VALMMMTVTAVPHARTEPNDPKETTLQCST